MNKKWPLHPKPKDNQLVSEWIRELAKLYEINYQNFCHRVFKLTIDETFYLSDTIPEKVLTILSNGTGISIDDLRWRNTSSVYKKLKAEYEVKIKEREFARKFANEVIIKSVT